MIENMQKLVITLDGPAGAGKGLIGSMLAKKFDLKYFQSSLIYRYWAYRIMQNHSHIINDEAEIVNFLSSFTNEAIPEQVNLTGEEIGNFASKISVFSGVRELATKSLRQIINNNPRIIMEGRDIGTVVAPNADLKIFLDANILTRAKRRYKQLCSSGKECILEEILALMVERDERDKKRNVAPLLAPEGALMIDSSDMTPEQVIAKIENYITNHKIIT